MNKSIAFVLLLFLFSAIPGGLMAQQGFGTNAPNASAVVEMKSNTKGVLFPRVGLKGTTDVVTIPSPADYLLVFNTRSDNTYGAPVTPGFYYWYNGSWVRLLVSTDNFSSWHNGGDNGTNATTNFIGTTDAKDLSLRTGGTEQVRIKADGSIGVHTSSPDAFALMHLNASTRGFLLPRMQSSDLYLINNPATGLLVYNTTLNCPMYCVGNLYMRVDKNTTTRGTAKGSTYVNLYNGSSNDGRDVTFPWGTDFWSFPVYSGTSTTLTHSTGEVFSDVHDCANATISAGGCGAAVAVKGNSGKVYPLVEINSQCWTAQNMDEKPGNSSTAPAYTKNVDTGSWGYYNTTAGATTWGAALPAAGEGLLYQWSAAMYGTLYERGKGICPDGFHIPSDCEWRYLTHGLGAEIEFNLGIPGEVYDRGFVGNKLRVSGASGFGALLSGCRSTADAKFYNRSSYGNIWTSTPSPTDNTKAIFRQIFKTVPRPSSNSVDYNNTVTVPSGVDSKGVGYPVRCLKD